MIFMSECCVVSVVADTSPVLVFCDQLALTVAGMFRSVRTAVDKRTARSAYIRHRPKQLSIQNRN
jgi:hypothetical protein